MLVQMAVLPSVVCLSCVTCICREGLFPVPSPTFPFVRRENVGFLRVHPSIVRVGERGTPTHIFHALRTLRFLGFVSIVVPSLVVARSTTFLSGL